MTSWIPRIWPAWLALLIAIPAALVGCGGGGGGGSGGSGAGGFTLSQTSVAFSAKRGGAAPAAQTLSVHLADTSAASLVAGYRTGVSAPAWLAATGSGSGLDYTFTLTATDTSLAAGTYTATLTIASRDAAGNDLQAKDVSITYTVRDGVLITSSPTTLTGVAGSPLPSQSVPITVTAPGSENWTATSDAAWVVAPSGTHQGSMTLELVVDPSALPAGTSVATVTLTNAADATDVATTTVTASLQAPTITASAGTIVLGGASGQEAATATATVTIDTGTNAYPLTLVPVPGSGGNWLGATSSPGTVSGAGLTTITLTADRSQLSPGSYSSQLNVQATVNGQLVSTPIAVTVNVDTNRLVVGATGVAFSSFPSRSVLTRSIAVGNVFELPGVTWQATSSQSWLGVTPTGTVGQPLVLTANPAGLAPGQYTAQVLVNSSTSGVTNVESIRVGLVVGASDPAALIELPGVSATFFATSPVEPWVFVSRGATVEVYDMYSGALVQTITTPAAAQGQLIVNGNGTRLYVVDSTSTQSKIYEMVIPSGAQSRTFISSNGWNDQFAYARPGAMPVLLGGLGGEAFDLTSGNPQTTGIGSPSIPGGGQVIVASPDSRYLYIADGPVSPSGTRSFRLRYALNASQLSATPVGYDNGIEATYARSNLKEMAVSPAGDKLYMAAGAPYQFDILDAPALTLHPPSLTGAPYPASIKTSWNGLVVGGAQTAFPDIWIYNTSGTFLGNLASSSSAGLNSLAQGSLTISGDGTRLLSGGAVVRIFALPHP